jgi:FeS assembly protein IscX
VIEIPKLLDQPREGIAMKWVDTWEIAAALVDAHPDVDAKTVRFVDLHNWVLALDEFDDDPKRARGMKILEAIQQAWNRGAGVDPRGDPAGRFTRRPSFAT